METGSCAVDITNIPYAASVEAVNSLLQHLTPMSVAYTPRSGKARAEFASRAAAEAAVRSLRGQRLQSRPLGASIARNAASAQQQHFRQEAQPTRWPFVDRSAPAREAQEAQNDIGVPPPMHALHLLLKRSGIPEFTAAPALHRYEEVVRAHS